VSTNPAEANEKKSLAWTPAWFGGFLLLGILLGLLGPLLIAWQYHIDVDPRLIGLHFLSLNGGYVIMASLSQSLLRRTPLRTLVLLSCAGACLSLTALAFLGPPVAPLWRVGVLAGVGASAGGLATALLYATEASFAEAPVRAINRAGVLFGCGCLVATVMTGATYFAGSVQLETVLLACFPLVYFFVYLLNRHAPARAIPRARHEDPLRETLKDLRSIATVLFSLLLFFQFGNEWVLAGWLPIFLVHRLGVNPVWALAGLGWYFLTLMIGRLAAQTLLPLVDHRRLLLGGTLLAMSGYLLLSFTAAMPGAIVAVGLIGAGYAPIYPLIGERLDDRFSFHPGFYNGTISIAVTGAMSTPWLFGYVNAYFGMRSAMLLPALGTVAVLILVLLIMFESHLMGGKKLGDKTELHPHGRRV
jgi:fucose permease